MLSGSQRDVYTTECSDTHVQSDALRSTVEAKRDGGGGRLARRGEGRGEYPNMRREHRSGEKHRGEDLNANVEKDGE